MPKTSAADNASDPKVSDLPCFSLFAAARAVANLYRPLLDRTGITYPQFLLRRSRPDDEESTVLRELRQRTAV
ncbi:hypothetical protein ACSHWB_26465 [Lentzea sp. HUAS TT2]|uniref:hypothetical protein n=1 Tax=Lentzea sp. HUAS TT2 TaxID=3447454 RepID=UPI003F723278